MVIVDILLQPGDEIRHYARPPQFPLTVCGEVSDYPTFHRAHAAVRSRDRPLCPACELWMEELTSWVARDQLED